MFGQVAEYIASTATFGCSDEEDSGSNDRTTTKAPEHGHSTLRDRTDGRVEYIDTTNKIDGDDEPGEDISIDLDEEDDEAAEA